jgi:hypothetical protein
MLRTATVKLRGISPYSQSRAHFTEKKDKEGPNDYEERTWRERLHVNEKGYVYIPPMAFKNSLSEIAKFLGTQIPGKGKSTYTKHFEAGVLVMEPSVLSVKKEDVPGEWLFVPASGVRGDGKRVRKCFPVIQKWDTEVVFNILDDTITPEVFEHHLREAGSFIGIGRFRPRNNGFYGRFAVEGKIKWS